MPRTRSLILSLSLLPFLPAVAGCFHAANHTELSGPRFAAPAPGREGSTDVLRLVSFNVKYGVEVDSAIALLEAEPWLDNADVVLLQEVDEDATQRIAGALGAGYVYYPATRHPRTRRNFGNAVVSRWPIEADRKVILPHLARIGGTQRIAVGATLRIGSQQVRVYSLHLATLIGNGPTDRREQLAAVLADAESFPVVVLGGDFNSETVPEIALARGYAWPTRTLPHTNAFWTFDHFMIKGLPGAASAEAGTVTSARGASDHLPVWTVLRLSAAADRQYSSEYR